jgi:uncharacterized protein
MADSRSLNAPPDGHQRLWEAVARRRKLAIGVLALVILSSLIGIRRLSYNNNIDIMLPADPVVQRTMHFLRTANLSHDVIISLSLNDNRHSSQELFDVTDRLLRSFNSPLVSQGMGNLAGGDVMQDIVSFTRYAPQLQTSEGYARMEKSFTPTGVQERLSGVYMQCLKPSGSFMIPFLRADPLGLSGDIQRNLTSLSTTLGSQMEVHNGFLATKDGRHAMIILKTPVVVTDGLRSRELVDYLRARLAALPNWVTGGIITGYTHTVSNESAIKHDLAMTSLVGGIGFLLLFLISFRDLRASIIFLTPPVAVLIATNLAFLVFGSLSSFVAGLSTVIAGIAIDYGIYVYVAVQRAGRSLETIRQVIRPVIFGGLTTISVFAAFFVSRVEGYLQLALLANLSMCICLFFSLFILPHFLGGDRPAEKDQDPRRSAVPEATVLRQTAVLMARMRFPVSDAFRIAIVGVFLLFFVALGPRLTFDNDITQYDATERSILAAEDAFHRTWGAGTTPAILVVPGDTLEEALQVNDAIYDRAIQALGTEHFSSISPLWPSKSRRQANLQRWETFWNGERETQLRAMLAEYGKTYQFSEDAFQPFLDHLHTAGALEDWPADLPFFDQLKERFVTKVDGKYQILSFFPAKEEYVSKLQAITKDYPQILIVDRRHFSQTVSQAAISELLRVSVIGILATILLTWWLLKSLRLMCLALLPVLISLVAILGVLSAIGQAINITAIIASLVTVGIVSDYGMFMVYYCQKQYNTGTCAAVTFAAITTLIGSGALLFATHPMLLSVGIVLSTGVLSGFVSSLVVVPPLYRIMCREPAS